MYVIVVSIMTAALAYTNTLLSLIAIQIFIRTQGLWDKNLKSLFFAPKKYVSDFCIFFFLVFIIYVLYALILLNNNFKYCITVFRETLLINLVFNNAFIFFK